MRTIKNKRGIFFTVGALLIVISFFLIVNISSKTTKIDKDIAMERAYNLASSVEKSILDIYYTNSDAKANITENPDDTSNVTFIENISSREDPWGQQFSQTMTNFKTFVESEDENIKINMSDINNKQLPVTIYPHGITYSRSWETGHVMIYVIPQQMNFGSYDITINTGNVEISKTTPHFRSNGTFLFSVTSKDNLGHTFIDWQYVDPADSHDVQIFFVNGNTATVSMTSTQLEIWTNEINQLNIETKLDNLVKSDEKIRIRIFNSVVNASFPSLGVYNIKDIVVEAG